MKATTDNIQYIAKQTLYKGEGKSELQMNLLLDMWHKTIVSYRVEDYEGETIEDGETTTDILCEKINNEGWDFDETRVAEEMAIDAFIENTPEVTPVPQQYICKSGYVMNVWFVDAAIMDKSDDWYEVEKSVKALRGWYDRKQGGYILRSEADAQTILNRILA